MISGPFITIVLAIYAAGLILIGWRSDRPRERKPRVGFAAQKYALSLGTLCSAWTYFGGVGDARMGGWMFLANALGPVLALTLGYPVWRRMAILAKQENVGSLADFLAARYGKSRMLGTICACIVTAGALPYLALQVDVLTRAWMFAVAPSMETDSAGVAPMLLLTGIAIMFGARHASLTQHARGFVSMLAVEACVKLGALLLVGGLALALLSTHTGGLQQVLSAVSPPVLNAPFLVLTGLCTITTFVLPRQFHLGFVTLERVEDTAPARWIVPVYFLAWSLATLMIGLALRHEAGMGGVVPELQVLALPMMHGRPVILMFALLGGMSAGAAMVAVEITATSAMIANEIALPLFAHLTAGRLSTPDIGRTMLHIRWATIMMVSALAWLYYGAVHEVAGPARLGVTALAAFAQFVPALIGGLYWRRGHAHGAVAGLLTGITIWAAGIAAPSLWPDASGSATLSSSLWPIGSHEQIDFAVVISLASNALLYVFVSLQTTHRPIDLIQARSFLGDVVDVDLPGDHPVRATLNDVRTLLTRFLGAEEAEKAIFEIKAGSRGEGSGQDMQITLTHSRIVEKILAGVIGGPAARNVVSIAIGHGHKSPRDFDRLLDEAAHAAHFSRELLQITLESLSQGIAVLDEDLRLLAWNSSFLRLLKLPQSKVHVGKPLSEIVAGALDLIDTPDELLQGQALVLAASRRHVLNQEWTLDDGRVLLVQGKPLDQGDYLATLSDITGRKAAERIMAQDNEVLERRVALRTSELREVNAALADATLVAQRASNAQKRFVAAASHDLVQPLHAARLFLANAASALEDHPDIAAMLERADQSVDAAHGLLKALLTLSRLETGALEPALAAVDAGKLLDSLADEFMPQARARGLTLIVRPTRFWVRTDRDLLRSMLQNLMLNALRYTANGRVLVALRFAGDQLRFEVRDTGVGILPDKVAVAFGEYSRLSEGQFMAEGAGLGLSIVARIGQVLDHPITVRSRPGKGSIFAITLPRTDPVAAPKRTSRIAAPLGPMSVLCIDDDRDILLGTKALIERWGGEVTPAGSIEEAPDRTACWDAILADHHLPGENGLSFLRRMDGRARLRVLITATPEEGWEDQLPGETIAVLRKPLSPLALHGLLARLT